MKALIEDLLTLAREGEAVAERKLVGLADVTDRYWQTAATGSVTVNIGTQRAIQADENRLRQLLENLFNNAIKHGGADVTVTVSDLEERTGFYVADDGPGIPADERDNGFNTGIRSQTTAPGLD